MCSSLPPQSLNSGKNLKPLKPCSRLEPASVVPEWLLHPRPPDAEVTSNRGARTDQSQSDRQTQLRAVRSTAVPNDMMMECDSKVSTSWRVYVRVCVCVETCIHMYIYIYNMCIYIYTYISYLFINYLFVCLFTYLFIYLYTNIL